MEKNYFNSLNVINVNGKTEKKGKLTYLSWAWAWGEVKKLFPDATYEIYENSDGWNYHTDGRTCWVKTGVTVEGIEHREYLPVMDNQNRSIPLERVTSFDVNKAIQRSLTKCCARHGLGLYIYAGEDLPEDENGDTIQRREEDAKIEHELEDGVQCEDCGNIIGGITTAKGESRTAAQVVGYSKLKYDGHIYCYACQRKHG